MQWGIIGGIANAIANCEYVMAHTTNNANGIRFGVLILNESNDGIGEIQLNWIELRIGITAPSMPPPARRPASSSSVVTGSAMAPSPRSTTSSP